MDSPAQSQSNSPAAARSCPSTAGHSGDHQQAAGQDSSQPPAADPSSERRLTAPPPLPSVGLGSLLASATSGFVNSGDAAWWTQSVPLGQHHEATAAWRQHLEEQGQYLTQQHQNAHALETGQQQQRLEINEMQQRLATAQQGLNADRLTLEAMEPVQAERRQEQGRRQQQQTEEEARFHQTDAELTTQAISLGAAITHTEGRRVAIRAAQQYYTGQHLPSGEPDSTITYQRLCLYYAAYYTARGLLAAAITGIGLSFYPLNTNKEDDTHSELTPEALTFLIFCAATFALSTPAYLYSLLYTAKKSCRRSQPLEDGAQSLASQARGLAGGGQLIADVGEPPANEAAGQLGGGALFSLPLAREQLSRRMGAAPLAGAAAAGGQTVGEMGAQLAGGGHRGAGAQSIDPQGSRGSRPLAADEIGGGALSAPPAAAVEFRV